MPKSQLPLLQDIHRRQYVLSMLRSLVPSLLVNIAGTLIIYHLLSSRFPVSSLIPLLLASLFPILGNILSMIRHRHLDFIGIMMLIGLATSLISVLLGGAQQLLLIRESVVTGVIGLACFVSLPLSKPLGYYFAKQLMAGNDPQTRANFNAISQYPYFRHALRLGTTFWGFLLLSEFAIRVVLVLTLPVITVLAIAPLVFSALIMGGVVMSLTYSAYIIQHEHSGNTAAKEHV